MSIRRVVPDIKSERVDESREFYVGVLGFKVAMDMGWVMTFASQRIQPHKSPSCATMGRHGWYRRSR